MKKKINPRPNPLLETPSRTRLKLEHNRQEVLATLLLAWKLRNDLARNAPIFEYFLSLDAIHSS